MTEYWDKPVKRYCGNCGKLILGYKTAEGIVKIQCPCCGMMSVMKKISRRVIGVDEHAPPSQNTY